MNKINNFFTSHGSKVITVLLILLYVKSCSVNNELTRVKKESQKNTELIQKLPTAKDLKIEGLHVEKRLIQSTDRKLLDVQRQSDIEKEIKTLEIK